MKKLLGRLGLLLLILLAFLFWRYPYLLRAVGHIYLKGHTTAYIADFTDYPRRKIERSPEVWHWPLHKQYNRIPLTTDLEKAFRKYGTVASLIIKNDSILIEKYYEGYTKDSLSNFFSMAKSIVASLVAKAIEEGKIGSWQDKVKKYLPGIKGPYADSVRIIDLAMMSGGTDWQENYYGPFNITAESYFTRDLDRLMLDKVRFVHPPGKAYRYCSGDTQFLEMIVRKATGKHLSGYLSEKFWKPMGMLREAWWNLDREDGNEKAFCCINADARDFARFGRLFLHKGNWNGRQLLDTADVVRMTRPHLPGSDFYGLQWWLFNYRGAQGYQMIGHLGQYVIVLPSENAVIVRLGHKKEHAAKGQMPADLKIYWRQSLKILHRAS